MKRVEKKAQSIPVKFKDETKVNPALREYFGYCLFKVAARLRLLMDQALVSHHIQSHHFGILRLLKLKQGISQIELGDELGIDKASMVKLIDHLEKHKYVNRKMDLKDRRVKNIQITEKGLKALGFCDSIKTEVEKEFFKGVNPDEQALLKKLIPRLLP
jgi:DNA-binding MarR family transcriptional regulator